MTTATKPHPTEVLRYVCKNMGTTLEGLREAGRSPRFVQVRDLCALSLRVQCGMTIAQIAQQMGWEKDSTASAAVRRARQALAEYPPFLELVEGRA